MPIRCCPIFSQPPRVVASLASYDGPDSAHLRRKLATMTGVQVKVEEDTTYNDETRHTTEGVHYLAVQGDGTLTGLAPETTTKYYHFGGQRIAMRRNGVVYRCSCMSNREAGDAQAVWPSVLRTG